MEATESAGRWIQKKLEKMGVEVVLNEKAVKLNDGNSGNNLKLMNSGREIDASEVVYTTGLHSVNSFLDSKFLNEARWIDVDDHFRVKGSGGRLFSLGDCCNLLYNSSNQINANQSVIGANLAATLKALEQAASNSAVLDLENDADLQGSLKQYAEGPALYCVVLGKNDGVLNYGWFCTQRLFPWFKNTKMLGMMVNAFGVNV